MIDRMMGSKYRVIKKVGAYDSAYYIVQQFIFSEYGKWRNLKEFNSYDHAIDYYNQLRAGKITDEGDQILEEC